MPEMFVPLPPRGDAVTRRSDEVTVTAPAWTRHPALADLVPLMTDPRTTDVFVNGAGSVFVDDGSGLREVPSPPRSEAETRALAVALVGAGGRHIDEATPCVDVRLDGGVRVHAVLPPLAVDGTLVSIRVSRLARIRLRDLERGGMFDAELALRLRSLVSERRNILVTGATGAGKTTLLAALLSEADPRERIVTIEDVAELAIDHPHHVRLEARQANLEGAGAIDLARLAREALRMRPDRLIVGECRGAEVRELLTALNTGHDGGAGTVHANSLGDVAARLEALGALAGLGDRALARQVASAIDVVIHVERDSGGRRHIAALGEPAVAADGRLVIEQAA
ncbi:hypothetical protein GCM10009808_15660 [Microbacterium sediminicola]|uniref:Bacterial type II secretion system protein E domain-containing protein n=1 Tax=Microbacterium sediminicola TaxID=415210 RepID=A0ABN2I5R1_9MICO